MSNSDLNHRYATVHLEVQLTRDHLGKCKLAFHFSEANSSYRDCTCLLKSCLLKPLTFEARLNG